MESTVWVGMDYSQPQAALTVGRFGHRIMQVGPAAGSTADWGIPTLWMPTADGGVSVSVVDLDASQRREIYSAEGIDESIMALVDEDMAHVYVFGVGTGLREVALATGTVRELVPGGVPSTLEGNVGLGDLQWSPSGKTIATSVCSLSRCVTQVVDGASGERREIDGFIGVATTDRYLIGAAGDRANDQGWSLFDLQTGVMKQFAPSIDAIWSGYAIDESRFLVYGTARDGGNAGAGSVPIILVDAASGEEREVYRQLGEPQVMYKLWRSPDWAVLGINDGGGISSAITNGDSWDLLDLRTGDLLVDMVPIQGARAAGN